MGSYVLVIQPIFYVIENSTFYTNLFTTPAFDPTPLNVGDHSSLMHFDINSEDSDIRMEGNTADQLRPIQIEDPENSSTEWFKYLTLRTSLCLMITLGSFMFPNINIMLAIGGSILGTLMTIVMPVMFYNRAFSNDPKHLKFDKSNRHDGGE